MVSRRLFSGIMGGKEYLHMKSPLQSKTIIFNLLYALVALAGLFGFAEFQPDDNFLELVALGVAAVNLWLRFRTKEPIGFGKG